MKKSVLLLIMVVYIASIVIIGFFGVKIGSYNVTKYVQRIELLNEVEYEQGVNPNAPDFNPDAYTKYIKFKFTPYEDELNNPNYVQLMWKVIPETATYRDVTFVHGENSKASVNEIGTVVFTGKTTLTIYITSTDGTNVRSTVSVIAY